MRLPILILLMLTAGKVFSQSLWEELTPLRDVEYTADIFFATNARGYLAGKQEGTILRTDNSGASWTKYQLPLTTTSNFYEIHFVSKDTGFFVGTASYRTTNGCNSYTTVGTSIMNMQSVWFTSKTTGFMAGSGGKVYKTTNTGNTWNLMTTGTTNALNSIHFANKDTGLAVGNSGTVIRTVDAGTTWSVISVPTGTFLTNVQFMNDTTAFIVGDYGCIYKSIDAGLTWTLLNTGFLGSYSFRKLRFYNSRFGYAVGTTNKIAFTSDGGQTWTLSSIPGYTNDFYSVAFRPDGTAFLGGVGALWQSSNYAGWQYNMRGVAASTLNDVHFVDADTGFVCGFGQGGDTYQTIIRTNNKGKVWTSKNTNNDFSSYGFHSMAFTSPTTGFIGANGTISVKTSNCGNTWSSMSSFAGFTPPFDMHFFNATTGYAAGGGVQVTTNAGATWTNNVIPGAPLLYALSFPTPTLGYVCGLNGKVYKTVNSCSTWTAVSPPTGIDFHTICFPTDSIGYVTGTSNACYKTLDGGTTWTTIPTGQGVKLVFTDKDNGYMLSTNGHLRKTTDGGQTFTTLVNGINNVLLKGGDLFNNAFYAVGQHGTVLRHVLGCTSAPVLNSPINGPITTCVNNTDTFSLPSNAGLAYEWQNTYGGQVSQLGISNTASIQWQHPGTYYVKASVSNACGTSATQLLQVTVHPNPATPVITQSGNNLISNQVNGIQWYLNGTLMPGETNDTLQLTQSGSYSVSYTDSLSCGSSSAPFPVTFTGIKSYSANETISVFPNPSAKSITVTGSSVLSHISFYDVSGRNIYEYEIPTGLKTFTLAPDVSEGTYFIKVSTVEGTYVVKWVRMNE